VSAQPHHAERDDVARVRERFEHLLAASLAIASEHSLPEVLQQVTDSAREVLQARYAALGVLAEDGHGLAQFVTSGISPEGRAAIGPLPEGRGLLGVVIREARPIRIARISDDGRSSGFPPNHPPMQSFLGVPIRARQRVYGNLYLTDKIGAAMFDDEDEAIAVMLAAQAAVAIDKARLHDETASLLVQVQQMQRQRDQFFAMINHELRNALTGVYGWAERVLRARTMETMERAGREVHGSAERMISLMNNLLDLSRLDAGRIQAVFRDTDIRRVAERAVGEVQPQADVKGVELRMECPAPPPMTQTDGLRLEQILVNLLGNAVRHSRPGDPVRLRIEVTGDELLFHVIDRGPGIPPEDQERIFEPFIRTDPESGLGSGLGLPVSRRLSEVLGGRLTVHSDLGRGATFTVALPRAAPGGHVS
jgi:signal transduction histidine kinase